MCPSRRDCMPGQSRGVRGTHSGRSALSRLPSREGAVQWCTRASKEARPPVLMLQAARCRPRQYDPATAQQQSQTARRKLTRHGCTVASGAPVQSNPAPGGERRRLRGSQAAKSWAEMKAAPQGHDFRMARCSSDDSDLPRTRPAGSASESRYRLASGPDWPGVYGRRPRLPCKGPARRRPRICYSCLGKPGRKAASHGVR